MNGWDDERRARRFEEIPDKTIRRAPAWTGARTQASC